MKKKKKKQNEKNPGSLMNVVGQFFLFENKLDAFRVVLAQGSMQTSSVASASSSNL